MKPVTGVGAPWYTSGVHMWNGAADTLNDHQFRQMRRSRPYGECAFAAGGTSAGDHGCHHGLANREAAAHLNIAVRSESQIDTRRDVEFPRQAVESGDGADGDRSNLNRHLDVLLMASQNLVNATEMRENADGRLARVTKGLDDAIVLDAVRLVGLK